MIDTPTIVLAREATSESRTTTGLEGLSPEIRADVGRRLAGAALLYAGCFAAAFGIDEILLGAADIEPTPPSVYVQGVFAIAMALGVFFAVRSGRLAPGSLLRLGLAFQVLGGLGIVAGIWGWEGRTEKFVVMLAERGLDVDRVVADGLPLFFLDGVSWLGVWILLFPLIVPMKPLQALAGSALTASMLHVVAVASQLVHGTPELAEPWLKHFYLAYTVPLVICVGVSWYGARIVFRLTRDLSRAKEMGSYHLVEKLGSGGMGEVWRAQHHMLARRAAIKLIRADALGATAGGARSTVIERFEREAQTTAGLESPHTIQLYDFGVTDEGAFYYVMELLDGVDLQTLIEKFGPVPAARAVHFLSQACHSLADAHENGLVHRDIKPANLVACRRAQDFDFLKVLDFGLVKHSDDVAGAGQKLTQEGVASGTPPFMAPETIHGAIDVDARADLYALGCVAYWLVTGELVFEGRTSMEILVRHAKEEPLPPSKRTELEVPASFERLVLDCLRKEPGDRPATARNLRCRLGEIEAEIGPWSPEDAEQWWCAHFPGKRVTSSGEDASST